MIPEGDEHCPSLWLHFVPACQGTLQHLSAPRCRNVDIFLLNFPSCMQTVYLDHFVTARCSHRSSINTQNTTQHNTTQHNTTQHNTTQHNTTQHNTTQHNATQHNTRQYNITPLNRSDRRAMPKCARLRPQHWANRGGQANLRILLVCSALGTSRRCARHACTRSHRLRNSATAECAALSFASGACGCGRP